MCSDGKVVFDNKTCIFVLMFSADEEESSTTEWTGCSSEPKDVARVLGILPGIGEYSGDSSDTTSSSESDLDDLFPQKTVIRKVHVVESNH